MTKNELIQISKIIKILIEREVANAQRPLLQEIKKLQTSINQVNQLLAENSKMVKSSPIKPDSTNGRSLNFSINDILNEV